MTIAFCDSRSTKITAEMRTSPRGPSDRPDSSNSSTCTAAEYGTSSCVQRITCSRTYSAASWRSAWSVNMSGGKSGRSASGTTRASVSSRSSTFSPVRPENGTTSAQVCRSL